jgi:2-polyprenyl-3-methyl-5-hydroxy-6-metoxy-1,4-benzoquinol methylase
MTQQEPSAPACVVCTATTLRELASYAQLPRVTSDCKPWPAGGRLNLCQACGAIQKSADAKWLDEIKRIYDAYQIYHLSGGAEQVIFSAAGQAVPRSHTLVDFVVSRIPRRERGRLIDLGCGNGSALASFSRALPGWRFDASELSDRALPILKSIPGFETLYTGRIQRDAYDVVSMIHSLEHYVSPHEALSEAAALLAPAGTLFVEVPDAETSPFDLLVADHRTHFTRATLGMLAARAALAPDYLDNNLLPKENTLLAHRAPRPGEAPADPGAGLEIVTRTLAWLEDVVEAATRLASRRSGIGIFGTSISAMWLYGALRDKVDFFVDEDRSRVGQDFEGRPIRAPEEVPGGAAVFVPLANTTAERVIARLSGGNGEYLAPPPMGVARPVRA